jgi:hypothetical protein
LYLINADGSGLRQLTNTPDKDEHVPRTAPNGKMFTYNCFEGTTGAGRIYPDGSVVGSIQIRGEGPVRYVALPAGTIKVKPTSICASVRGLPLEPCFNVVKLDENRFRGSISGLGFAYCTFTRRNPRLQIADSMAHARAAARAEVVARSTGE